MNPSLKDITGIILAGGRSLRYGKNKAFEPVGGIPLIKRVVNVLEHLFDEVIIIANEPDRYSFLSQRKYEDIIKGIGPIAGVLTGVMHMKNEAGFFVACDMPFLNSAVIKYLAEMRDGFDIVIPKIGKNVEPLHAIYTKDCLPFIKENILHNKFSLRDLLSDVTVRYVQENELRRYDPELTFLTNINEPEDMRRIKNKCLNL